MMEQLTDRGAAPADFVEFITKLAGPSHVTRAKNSNMFSAPSKDGPAVVGPMHFGVERRQPIANDVVVPNRYALFAQAYAALSTGRYEQANELFDQLGSFYDIESAWGWNVVLPYFSLAAAQSGDKYGLGRYLGASMPQGAFGADLSKAIFAALRGEHTQAEQHLNTARKELAPNPEWPVSPSYLYAEICSRLFDLTHYDGYRQRALEWARLRQKLEPTQAWTYALTARLSSDEQEQVTAAAIAGYLDPQSHWLSEVPEQIRAAAAARLKANPPFALRRAQGGSDI